MIERTHLLILREVDRLGTLTEAARSLCLTQSALSHAIKKLEGQLNTQLWTKEGRTLRLTQAGKYLLNVSKRLLPQLEHAEAVLGQFAQGQRGILRVGMECHPCYQWLLRVVSPFLTQWPDVDVDVKQKFQFGGIGALLSHDIDLLITPDPLFKSGLLFRPVFDYELVMVMADHSALSKQVFLKPSDIVDETLITYPVSIERLDVYSQFLIPGQCLPKQHKTIETTDIMLQMVAAGRGITALPAWLVDQYATDLNIKAVRLGEQGIHKQIYTGVREADGEVDYIESFISLSQSVE
jgi:LysR family transcriptional regulator, regulator for metE and metH